MISFHMMQLGSLLFDVAIFVLGFVCLFCCYLSVFVHHCIQLYPLNEIITVLQR